MLPIPDFFITENAQTKILFSEKDIGKTFDYERKAYLMTSPGMEEVAMKNMPKAGQLIS